METLRWRDWEGHTLENCAFGFEAECLMLECVVAGISDETCGGHYRVRTDAEMRTREVLVEYLGRPKLHVVSDGAGNWRDTIRDRALPMLRGCVDVDIAITPSTNTLPIKRLRLKAVEATEISVVYIPLPEQITGTFLPWRAEQRYTCLIPGQRYRYKSLPAGFAAELEVDEDGFVLDYPPIFRRIHGDNQEG